MYRQQVAKKPSASVQSTPISKDITLSPSYGSLSSVVQRTQQDPNTVRGDEWKQLESAIGTRATGEILAGKQIPWVPEFKGISAQLWGDTGGEGVSIQTKLTIGEVGDKYEQEADNVAKKVVEQINRPAPVYQTHDEVVQSKEQEDEEELRMKGIEINDDEGLEREADVMGQQAVKVEKVNSVEAKPNEISLPSNVMQRRIAAWNIVQCNSGTIVYHNTGQDGAVSLCTDGVRQVQNAWGGGILGAGFYTHTTRLGAEVYGNKRFTIEYRVTNDLTGQVVPRGVIGRGIDNQRYPDGSNYVEGNDFLTNEDDRNEYKFHNGNNLQIVRIYDIVANRSYNSIQTFLNAILQ